LKSNLISKSETAKVLGQINSQWKIKLPKQKNLKFHQINESGIIITGNGITAVKIADDILPFLDNISILEMFPNVMVDAGAIKFEKGQIVCVVEESQHKFLAVGKAEMSSEQMEETDKGIAVKNIHYISDDYWEAKKELKC
jgi:PUA domain protein